MKTVATFLILLIVGVVGLTMYKIRTAEHDVALWHVDPLTAESPLTPNFYRVAPAGSTDQKADLPSPIYTGDIAAIAQAFDTFVLTQRDTIRIAGSVEELWLTYVQRTPRLKMPDYVSVKFVPMETPEKVGIVVFSRSRYGNGDMGANQTRIETWIKSLDAFID